MYVPIILANTLSLTPPFPGCAHSTGKLTGRELFEQNSQLADPDALFGDGDGDDDGGDGGNAGVMRLLQESRERKRLAEEAAERGEEAAADD
jgi:hypothetical protein